MEINLGESENMLVFEVQIMMSQAIQGWPLV